ncbi:hypothetical protein [Winogradskyella sp. MH6]|uniref:hypothetical protein n=1 Tax=Winogradskyella sp. MH6 TaxID=2929510 RepID=UPI001FB232F9|nr:hypothetical protein [Winogradskyella sp. MH6]
MDKLKILLIILPFVLFSCKKEYDYGNSELFEKIDLTDINILKGYRTKFDNDTLRVKGKVTISFENISIGNGDSWIWVDSFEPAVEFDTVYNNLNYREVELIGLFDSKNTGHLGQYNGGFEKIYAIKTE